MVDLEKKMISFLKSINIENYEDFDLTFKVAERNKKNSKQIDMVIVKETPWKYSLLNQFQEGLSKVPYPYNIRFLYTKRPTPEDAYNLFFEWYQNLYHIPSKVNASYSSKSLKFVYKDEEEKDKYFLILFDFRDFLSFINYEILIEEDVYSPEAPIEEEEIKEIPKEVKKEEELSDIDKMIHKEKSDLASFAEDHFLGVMKDNLKAFQEEKENQRLYKRGNYNIIDAINDITLESDHVDFIGKVFSIEEKEYTGKARYIIGVYDHDGEGAIFVEQVRNASFPKEVADKLVRGTNIRVRGVVQNSPFNKGPTIRGHYIDLLPPDDFIPDLGGNKS